MKRIDKDLSRVYRCRFTGEIFYLAEKDIQKIALLVEKHPAGAGDFSQVPAGNTITVNLVITHENTEEGSTSYYFFENVTRIVEINSIEKFL